MQSTIFILAMSQLFTLILGAVIAVHAPGWVVIFAGGFAGGWLTTAVIHIKREYFKRENETAAVRSTLSALLTRLEEMRLEELSG